MRTDVVFPFSTPIAREHLPALNEDPMAAHFTRSAFPFHLEAFVSQICGEPQEIGTLSIREEQMHLFGLRGRKVLIQKFTEANLGRYDPFSIHDAKSRKGYVMKHHTRKNCRNYRSADLPCVRKPG